MAEETVNQVEEQEPVMVTLELTLEEVNQILKIMGESSFNRVNGLIQKVYTQGMKQMPTQEEQTEE